MKQKYSRSVLLSILQQAEYDLVIWQTWQNQERSASDAEKLSSLTPEKWTLKLKLINFISSCYELLFSTSRSIRLAVLSIQPFEKLATSLIVWLATLKLRRYQKKGLVVIGVAGSYGKTSVKHLMTHTLSQQWFTLSTPASYNTPLGISLTVIRQLTPKHQIFITELGEYKRGDLDDLLSWIRPQYGVITPIGFAHGDRFSSNQDMMATFQEMLTSKFAPSQLIIDDINQEIFSDSKNITWYGDKPTSIIKIKKCQLSQTGTTGEIEITDEISLSTRTRLWGQHQLRNSLPGLQVLIALGGNLKNALAGLAYAPNIPRRLSITHNQNGTTLIDNSYNTNPGSWAQMFELLRELHLPDLAIITGGFVELDGATYEKEHQKLAKDLNDIAQAVVIIRTRNNSNLIEALKKQSVKYIVADSFEEAVWQLQNLDQPIKYLWLEGGSRELYS